MCLNPLTIKNKNPNKFHPYSYIEVPCGKCYECAMKKRSQWCFRLEKELEGNNQSNYFITLTYHDDFLPIKQVYDYNYETDSYHCRRIPCFDRVHIRNFVRSIRDKFRYECKKVDLDSKLFTGFKYFVSSEYGFKSLRPHYHMLLFDVPFDLDTMINIINDHWKYGFVSVYNMNANMIYYTCKYILKQDWIKLPNLPEGSDRNFILCSKNLGLCFLTEEMKNYIYSRWYEAGDICVKYHDRDFVLPRYYRDKLFDGFDRLLISEKLISDYDRFKRCPDSADPVEWLYNRISSHEKKVLENMELELC